MDNYQKFLESKRITVSHSGFDLDESAINPILFPFQRDIVLWSLLRGKSAIFADCGLGKSFMQIEWAWHIHHYTNKPVLIVAPLGVTGQTIQEGVKLDYEISYYRDQNEMHGAEKLIITNYEMLKNFNLSNFGGLVLDESSILKNYTGKTKRLILNKAQGMQFKLACTATPAPNDHLELGNHAEFLGIMPSREMIQRWFVNDSMKAGGYRLREHGQNDFWSWVASWAVSMQRPSDIGDYSDEGYILPDLNFEGHIVPVDHTRAWNEQDKRGQLSLLLVGNTSATTMHKEKRATIQKRMKNAAALAKEIEPTGEPILIWCEYNYEADELVKLLPNAVEIRGNEKPNIKQQKLLGFGNGDYQILITKPKIASFGLNWQHCGTQIWTSINHKFESFYQGYKRSHRFGRKNPVDCHIVYAESEGNILSNLNRKHAEHMIMQREMVRAMRKNGMSVERGYRPIKMRNYDEYECGPNWKLYHGDSAITLKNELDNSVDLIVQSPPFKSLYIYSDNLEDLGNAENDQQFYDQYQFILNEEIRIAKPGSYKAEHCKDLPLYANRDGAMGLQDFPGELIKAHLEAGWWFIDWITIWKDPVIEMQRTKNAGLLWSSAFCERAERARQGMADYVLIFQKPIKGQEPPSTRIDAQPMQQSVADRCMDLWTNEDEKDKYSKNNRPIIIHDKDCHFEPKAIREQLQDGRNYIIQIYDPAEMHILIEKMRLHKMIFHSRIALTDGTWLLVFRKWVDEMSPDKNPNIRHVKHDLVAGAHRFIGTDGPKYYEDDRDYSIQVWQRYASPVWYDLPGLPSTHKNIWFDIKQTNVLNHRIAREDKDEKHICPLQIDLIERCIDWYTKPGDRVHTSFAGVGSEIATAIRMGRKAIGSELKRSYYELALQNIREIEQSKQRITLFEWAGV